MIQHPDGSVTLTREEWASTSMLAVGGAKYANEDVVGGLMKYGAFWLLKQKLPNGQADPNDPHLCDLANLIEKGEKDFDVLREQALKEYKKHIKSRTSHD
jgi:hypothetical protein